MNETPRTDEQLLRLDIHAAFANTTNPDRTSQFVPGDVIVSAALRLEAAGVGPHPVAVLAGCVRALGLDETLRLPELLPATAASQLIRDWTARLVPGPNVARDEALARLFESVATVMRSRRATTRYRLSRVPWTGQAPKSEHSR